LDVYNGDVFLLELPLVIDNLKHKSWLKLITLFYSYLSPFFNTLYGILMGDKSQENLKNTQPKKI
jgi:hypothetical protein